MLKLTQKQKGNEQWYKENLVSFLKDRKLKGKYLVIHNKEIKKSFDNEHKAIEFAFEKYQNFNECIVREVIDEKSIVNFLNVKFSPSKTIS